MKNILKSLPVPSFITMLFIAIIAIFIATLGLITMINELDNLRKEVSLCKKQIAEIVENLDLGEMEQGDYEMESTLTA